MNEFLCGAFSGLCQSFIGHPLNTLKVWKQNNIIIKNRLNVTNLYRGISYPIQSSIVINSLTFSIYYKINTQYPSYFYSGLLTGLIITPIQFAYDVATIKRQMNYKFRLNDVFLTKGFFSSMSRQSLGLAIYFSSYHNLRNNNTNIIFAGGISGLTHWIITYPIDVVNTRQITNNISIKDALIKGNLYNGIEFCLLRAVIVNIVAFFVYENSLKLINKNK
jgi:solute carrier family 25 (mitochondrial carnitine/acylcarnitine transporter), member 20/29